MAQEVRLTVWEEERLVRAVAAMLAVARCEADGCPDDGCSERPEYASRLAEAGLRALRDTSVREPRP